MGPKSFRLVGRGGVGGLGVGLVGLSDAVDDVAQSRVAASGPDLINALYDRSAVDGIAATVRFLSGHAVSRNGCGFGIGLVAACRVTGAGVDHAPGDIRRDAVCSGKDVGHRVPHGLRNISGVELLDPNAGSLPVRLFLDFVLFVGLLFVGLLGVGFIGTGFIGTGRRGAVGRALSAGRRWVVGAQAGREQDDARTTPEHAARIGTEHPEQIAHTGDVGDAVRTHVQVSGGEQLLRICLRETGELTHRAHHVLSHFGRQIVEIDTDVRPLGLRLRVVGPSRPKRPPSGQQPGKRIPGAGRGALARIGTGRGTVLAGPLLLAHVALDVAEEVVDRTGRTPVVSADGLDHVRQTAEIAPEELVEVGEHLVARAATTAAACPLRTWGHGVPHQAECRVDAFGDRISGRGAHVLGQGLNGACLVGWALGFPVDEVGEAVEVIHQDVDFAVDVCGGLRESPRSESHSVLP